MTKYAVVIEKVKNSNFCAYVPDLPGCVSTGDTLEDLLPSGDAGPEAAYARSLLLDALDEALEELPENQREVFIAHELMGQSFKEISIETGQSVNTLLSRKHYAVLHLRQRLQLIYENYAKK